ncbi:MAG TPA: hypothetical protein DHW10_04230 [Rhodospirillaceae bacterium]|nr:hypothetical protein [Rhodospirillaceae bacterium]
MQALFTFALCLMTFAFIGPASAQSLQKTPQYNQSNQSYVSNSPQTYEEFKAQYNHEDYYQKSPAYKKAYDRIHNQASQNFMNVSAAVPPNDAQGQVSPYYTQTSSLWPSFLAQIGSWIAGLPAKAASLLVNLGTMFTNMVTDQVMAFFGAGEQGAKYVNAAAENGRKSTVRDNAIETAALAQAEDARSQREHSLHLQEKESDIHVEANIPTVTQRDMEVCIEASGRSDLTSSVGAYENSLASSAAAAAYRGSGGKGSDTEKGPLQEIALNYQFAALFCNPNDSDAAAVWCPAECNESGEGDKQCNGIKNIITDENGERSLGKSLIETLPGQNETFSKHPGIYNLDTNYTKAIDLRRTWGLGHYWETTADGKMEKTAHERMPVVDRKIADHFMTSIFDEAVPPLQKKVVEDAYDPNTGRLNNEVAQHLLDRRSIETSRSVAKNSFLHIISRRQPFSTRTASKKTVMYDFAEVFYNTEGLTPEQIQTGMNDYFVGKMEELTPEKRPTEDGEKFIIPGYEAQLEFLAKLMYLHPSFVASASDRVDQKILLATATKSIVSYDLMQSMIRQEAILATLLETLLADKQAEVEAQARRINGGS